MNRIFKFNSLISVLCAFYIFNTVQVIAAEPELIHYDGYYNKIISCFLEHSGYIWVGTASDGIRKIDTITDEIEILKSDNSGLKGNYIYDMLVDKLNKVWISTDKGLNVYDNNNWIYYDSSNSIIPIIASKKLTMDSSGRIWVSTYPNELFSFDGNTWKKYDIITKNNFNTIQSIQADQGGSIWIISNNQGLIRFDGVNTISYDTLKTILPYLTNSNIAFDKNNNLWISNLQSKIVKFDGIRWEILDLPYDSIISNYINKLVFDNQNNLILFGNGIKKFDGNSWEIIHKDNSELSDNIISAFFLDSKSNYWLGMCYDGLAKYSNGIFKPYNLNLKELISFNINSLNVDKNNRKLILSPNGLSILDSNLWDNKTYSNSFFPRDFIYSYLTCIDDFGNIWIVNKSESLWMFNDTVLVNISKKYPEFIGSYISKLINHKNGYLYVTSYKGISRFDGTDWEFVIKAAADSSFGTYKDYAIDDNGIVWKDNIGMIASYDGSKWVYDVEKTIKDFYYEYSIIGIDSKGNKWLNTELALLKFDGSNWQKYVSPIVQSPNDYAWKMTIDKKDNVWLISKKGDLTKFDGTSWKVMQKLINVAGDFNQIISINADTLNNIWIATKSKGVYVYREGGVKLTSVEDMQLNELERIIIYPNPAENRIKFSNMANPGDKYIITDLSGKKVQIGTIESDELDISTLKSGFYFIIITTKIGNYTVKFVKE